MVPLVRGTPFDCLLILAVLLLAGFVALGAYAHGRFGRPAFGRWLVWGAVIGLLLIVAAMTTLAFPEDNVVVLMRVTTFDLIFPWRNAFIAGPNLLSLILGPSLFGGLAVVAAIATGSSSAGAKARSAVNSTREQLELGQGETAVESSTTQT